MDVAITNRNVVKGAVPGVGKDAGLRWVKQEGVSLSILPSCPLTTAGPACASPSHGGCCQPRSLSGGNSGVSLKARF